MICTGYRNAQHICDQIKEQMRAMVISCALHKDERLPAVSELSSRMAVNPNMVAQAYNDLEKEGYVYRIEGAGTYAADREAVDRRRRQELFWELDRVVTQLASLSVSAEEISSRIETAADRQGDSCFDQSK